MFTGSVSILLYVFKLEVLPCTVKTTVSQTHSFSFPTTEAGGGNTGDVSSTDESTVAVIVGVVLAVCFAAVLLALVVAAIICCRIKVLKKYSIAIHSRNNGELSTCVR